VVAGLLASLVLVVASGMRGADAAGQMATPAQNTAGNSQGVDSLVPAPPGVQQGNQPTLAERYPAWAYTPFNVDARAALLSGLANPAQGPANVLFNVWAGVVMMTVAIVGILTSRLIEWTFSIDVVSGAGSPMARVVQTLADQVYTPLLATALILVGAWLVWTLLLRRRMLHGLQGVAWAVLAVLAASVYFAAPVQVMSGLDSATAQLSRTMLSAIGGADPVMATRAGDPSLSQGDPSSAELRAVVDRYWRTFVFVPWSVAALGDSSTGQRYGEELLAKQSGLPSTFDADFQQAPQSAQDWYDGSRGGDRMAIVSMALLVILAASILFLFIAGIVVVAQLGLLLLLMVAPLFLLVGVLPGTGRRLLIRWAELVAGTLMVRILASAFLAVVLVLSGLVNQASGAGGVGGWGLAAAMQMALLATAFIYRKPFLRIFGQVASPRLAFAHVSHSKHAERLHGFLDGRVVAMRRSQSDRPAGGMAGVALKPAPATTNAARTSTARGQAVARASAAGSGAGAAAGASSAGLALAALEAGKLAVRGVARGTRIAHEAASPFVLGARGPTPPPPRFTKRPSAKTASSGMGSAAPRFPPPLRPRDQSITPPSADSRRGRPAADHTYSHWRSGETVRVASRNIILPGGWQRVSQP